jgi:predicted transcriptional regulator
MKEDILEQLVDDYLQNEGYFTMHNLKFKPTKEAIGFETKKDSVASDIDVIGFNPHRRGPDRVWVVNCKSWQSGVNLTQWFSGIEKNKVLNGRSAWKAFRELDNKKWADAFVARIEELTGTHSFTYVLAATKLKGDQSVWVEHEKFRKNLHGNPIMFLTVDKILDYIKEKMGKTKTVASSDVGRLLQVMKACGWMNKKD